MRPTLITLVSPRPWESDLVTFAHRSALAAIAGRCSRPAQVDHIAGPGRTVVVGDDTPWLTRGVVDGWRRAGMQVLGVATDPVSNRRLADLGCDAVVEDHASPARMLAGIIGMAPARPRPVPPLVRVMAPRGAPGCTEVAIGLAWAGGATLVDLDAAAPSLGLRLDLPPCSEPTRLEVGPVALVLLPPGLTGLSVSLAGRLIDTARMERLTVLDCGPEPWRGNGPMSTLLVTDGSEPSCLRIGRLLAAWPDDPPLVVCNRIPTDDRRRRVRRVRAATGLEPAVVVGVLEDRRGAQPLPGMAEALTPVLSSIGAGAAEAQVAER